MNINCTVQPHAILPTYATDGSAALDVYASEDVLVWGSDQPATLVPTGVTFAIPPGHAMLVFPRSGHAVKRGLRLATGTSVIDPDYRGELFIPLVSDHPLERGVLVKAGDRTRLGWLREHQLKRTIDMGHERQSGRTTIMLATLAGLQHQGHSTLYVAFNQSNAGWARARGNHGVRCLGAEAFMKHAPAYLRELNAIAVDDLGHWPRELRDEVATLLDRAQGLQLIMRAL